MNNDNELLKMGESLDLNFILNYIRGKLPQSDQPCVVHLLHCRIEHPGWVYETQKKELSINSKKWTKILKDNFDIRSKEEAHIVMNNPENFTELEQYTESKEEQDTLKKITGVCT